MDMGTGMGTGTTMRISDKLFFLIRQILITGINALIGFVILRGLTKTDYALYTIVFSMLAIFSNITNVGITPAMSGIGGKIWNNRREMQTLLNTALRLRSQLGWWFVTPFVAYCIWLFGATGAGWGFIILLVLTLLFSAWVQLQSAFYAIVLQLNQAIRQLQQNELIFSLIKFSGVLLFLFLRCSVVVIVGWIAVCTFLNFLMNKQLAGQYTERHAEIGEQYQKEINDIIRSNFARTVYWSLEGQISILLCTVFASTDNIAEIGALGRLSVYFAIFQSFILNYGLPKLAKSHDRTAIQAQTRRILSAAILLILPILLWSVLHPQSLIWILGPNYESLRHSLFAFLLASSIGQLATVVYQVCAAKAWIQMNRFYVPLALPLQAGLIYLLDLSKIDNIILFLFINNLFFLVFNFIMFYFSLNRHQPAQSIL